MALEDAAQPEAVGADLQLGGGRVAERAGRAPAQLALPHVLRDRQCARRLALRGDAGDCEQAAPLRTVAAAGGAALRRAVRCRLLELEEAA